MPGTARTLEECEHLIDTLNEENKFIKKQLRGNIKNRMDRFASDAMSALLRKEACDMDAREISVAAWAYAEMMMEIHDESF